MQRQHLLLPCFPYAQQSLQPTAVTATAGSVFIVTSPSASVVAIAVAAAAAAAGWCGPSIVLCVGARLPVEKLDEEGGRGAPVGERRESEG